MTANKRDMIIKYVFSAIFIQISVFPKLSVRLRTTFVNNEGKIDYGENMKLSQYGTAFIDKVCI